MIRPREGQGGTKNQAEASAHSSAEALWPAAYQKKAADFATG